MDRLTNEQRLQIIEFYYQNSCSVRNVHRALLPFYGRHSRPSEQTIRKIVTKFRTKFTLLDIKPPTRLRTVRSEENIAAVSVSVTEGREMSIRRRSQQIKKDNPGSKVTDIAKRGAMKDKSEWEAKAIAMKEKYTKDIKEYEANGGTDTGAKKRKTKATKPAKKIKKKETSEEESGEDESD